jgi:hypothetical protein
VKTDFKEIDKGAGYIGYQEAFDIIGTNVRPLGGGSAFPRPVQGGLLPLTLWRR